MERIPLIPLFLVESIYVLLRNQVLLRTEGCTEEWLLTLLRFFAIVALFLFYRNIVFLQELRQFPHKSLYRLSFFLSLGLLSFYAVVNTQGTGDNVHYSALMFLVTPLVGIHEELAIRRILQRRLRQQWGLAPTLLVSNVVFCLFHFGIYSAFRIQDYGEIFLVGSLLGILYERTRSLLLVAFLHTAYDWIWIFGPFLAPPEPWRLASLALLVIAFLFASRTPPHP